MNARMIILALLALGMIGCSTYGGGYRSGQQGYDSGRYGDRYYGDSGYGDYRNCSDCGVVQRIDRVDDGRRGGAGGAVAGALIGGVVGSQVGSGRGRDAATVAGAVAGGLVGRDMARRSDDGYYVVFVRLYSGHDVRIEQYDLNGVREGSEVVVRDGHAQLR